MSERFGRFESMPMRIWNLNSDMVRCIVLGVHGGLLTRMLFVKCHCVTGQGVIMSIISYRMYQLQLSSILHPVISYLMLRSERSTIRRSKSSHGEVGLGMLRYKAKQTLYLILLFVRCMERRKGRKLEGKINQGNMISYE